MSVDTLDFYTLDRSTSANLVLSCAGDYRDATGSSRGISNEIDRAHLVRLRRQAGAVVTDGATARIENYAPRASFETYIFSRDVNTENRLTFTKAAELQDVVNRIQAKHERTLFETGPRVLRQLLEASAIDALFVSIVHGLPCQPSHFELEWNRALVANFLQLPSYVGYQVGQIDKTVLLRFDFGVA